MNSECVLRPHYALGSRERLAHSPLLLYFYL
jgi:hypothetical protein